MLIAISLLNIILWLTLAIATGQDYELFFPTIALFPGAILSGFLLKSYSYWGCVCLKSGSALIADLMWIVYEISFIDKTSHNLAPFELIATGLFATLIGLCGVGPGKLYQRFANRE